MLPLSRCLWYDNTKGTQEQMHVPAHEVPRIPPLPWVPTLGRTHGTPMIALWLQGPLTWRVDVGYTPKWTSNGIVTAAGRAVLPGQQSCAWVSNLCFSLVNRWMLQRIEPPWFCQAWTPVSMLSSPKGCTCGKPGVFKLPDCRTWLRACERSSLINCSASTMDIHSADGIQNGNCLSVCSGASTFSAKIHLFLIPQPSITLIIPLFSLSN